MNILTVDVEDWFHIDADKNFLNRAHNEDIYPSRIKKNLLEILDLFDKNEVKGTFFCLGWIALKYPDLIKEIANRGHEIGCHSNSHFLVKNMTPEEFNEDTRKAIDLISNVSGKPVNTYRAPCFSITESNNWAFDILLDNGIEIDCSIFPGGRDNGGYRGLPNNGSFIFQTTTGRRIKEMPISLFQFKNIRFCYSGGGYFRLLPFPISRKIFQNYSYNMFYIHPRDIDSGQPVLEGLSLARRFKSYYGLGRCKNKLTKLLSEFNFLTVEAAASTIVWDEVPVIELKN